MSSHASEDKSDSDGMENTSRMGTEIEKDAPCYLMKILTTRLVMPKRQRRREEEKEGGGRMAEAGYSEGYKYKRDGKFKRAGERKEVNFR